MITRMPEITSTRFWNPFSVQRLCIKKNWYTAGDNEEYQTMLDFVWNNPPTPENIYWVAADILEHTGGVEGREQTVSNIMFYLENDVVMTTYYLDGELD